ncbi:MAG TPA: histidinol-phosphate transaminase [Acidobacteriaceae bacterium]|nr:histidinol-phosphate transaminase [Acidobacteriaceae bacterium]
MPETVLQRTPEPRIAVQRMHAYHPPLSGRQGLRLDFNENTVACSPRVLEALGRIAASDLAKYPERAQVEARVAQHLGLQPDQVLLTNGVDEAIHVLCQTYLDRGDEFLFPTPTYSMYEIYGSCTDATVRMVPSAEDFAFPLEPLCAAITAQTRLIAIASPNSPTGTVATREQIVELLNRAPHAVVLVDEAYFHFCGQTVMDLVGQAPNLVVARTFSKAYGLAGLRLGMLAAPAGMQKWLRTVISPYSVNSLALACLPAALDDEAYLQWYVEEVKAARTEMVEELRQLGLPQWPTQANFVLVKIGALHAAFVQAMHRRGVLTRDRSKDQGCAGCVRITVGTREQMKQAVAAISDSLKEIGWQRA